jgi:hypothetical protein
MVVQEERSDLASGPRRFFKSLTAWTNVKGAQLPEKTEHRVVGPMHARLSERPRTNLPKRIHKLKEKSHSQFLPRNHEWRNPLLSDRKRTLLRGLAVMETSAPTVWL